MTTPSQIADAIVNKFMSSLPTIMKEVEKERKKNNSSGSGNSSSSNKKHSNISNDRELVRRMKGERDITKILHQQLKERSHELKMLRLVNDHYAKMVKKQGTYNNETQHTTNNLVQSLSKISTSANSLFKTMDDFSRDTRDISLKMSKVKERMEKAINAKASNNANTTQEEIDKQNREIKSLRKLAEEYSKQMHLLSSNDDIKKTMSDDLTIVANAASRFFSSARAQLPNTQDSDMLSFLTKITNNMEYVDEQININQQAKLNDARKQFKQNDMFLGQLEQQMDHLNHLAAKKGDLYGDDLVQHQKMLDIQAELRVTYDKFMTEAKQTPEALIEFNETVTKAAKELEEVTNKLEKRFNKPAKFLDAFSLMMKQMRASLFSGKNSDGSSNNGKPWAEAMDNFISNQPKILKLALNAAKTIGGYGIRATLDIAEDQRAVQKYGVNMEGLLTNMRDSIATGISSTELAEWKYKNRSTNTILGGERAATNQFQQFMMTSGLMGDFFSNTKGKAHKLKYNNQDMFFSELIGGSSEYQKETYDTLTDSLSKLGITPNTENISNMLTNNGGIMDVSYRTGQLPKELAQFMGDLTDNLSNVAVMQENGTETFIDSMMKFQEFGRTVGLNTEATKQLTNSILNNARVSAVDNITRRVKGEALARFAGANEKDAKIFGSIVGTSGKQKTDLIQKYGKDKGQRELWSKLLAAPVSQNNSMGGFDAQNFFLAKFMNDNDLMGTIDESAPAFVNMDVRTSLADKFANNNKYQNPKMSEFSQDLEKLSPILKSSTLIGLALTNAIDKQVDAITDNTVVLKKLNTDNTSVFGVRQADSIRASAEYDIRANVTEPLQEYRSLISGDKNSEEYKNYAKMTPEQQLDVATRAAQMYVTAVDKIQDEKRQIEDAKNRSTLTDEQKEPYKKIEKEMSDELNSNLRKIMKLLGNLENLKGDANHAAQVEELKNVLRDNTKRHTDPMRVTNKPKK